MWTVVAVGIWLLVIITCLVVCTYLCRRRAQPSTLEPPGIEMVEFRQNTP